MRKSLFPILILLTAAIMLNSCKSNINFNLPSPPPLLVVEGVIATDSVPYVILTRNSSYYGTTQLSDLGGIFVHGATVKISDGTDTIALPEITFDTSGVVAGVYMNPFSTFKGQANHTYYLWVEAGSQKVSAVTTIPPLYPLDSIWVEENVNPNQNLVTLMCRFAAPSNPNEYIRYFTRIDKQPFYPGLNSVFNNSLTAGQTFNFPLDRGLNRNDTSAYKNFGYFFKGDTITVKWCQIDYATYNFWNTLEMAAESMGPFSSPIDVQGNITGGLGIWSGYNPSYKTVIVPK